MKDVVEMAEFEIQKPENGPEYIRSRGIRFPNDKRIVLPRIRRSLRDRTYEMNEVEAVRAMVNRDDVVIELGAGMGYMSALMANNLQVKMVHAFEANPQLIPYINEVYRVNGIENARVTNAILGAKKGKVNFYVRRNFLASSMEENPRGNPSHVTEVAQVEVMNAKQVFQEIKPTVLVCDIEGAEADLLPHCDLSSLRAAVIELHPQWIGQKGVQAVFDAMQGAGLTFFPHTSNKKVVAFKKGW